MRGTFEEPSTGLIHWFSKTEGNTYATIAASPFPLQGKPTQAQDVAVDPTWLGEVASDQNFGRRTNDLLQKVVNFSLRPPAFDLLFLDKKRTQMKNYDLSAASSEGHKLTYFL